jgi:hypothetical protein
MPEGGRKIFMKIAEWPSKRCEISLDGSISGLSD